MNSANDEAVVIEHKMSKESEIIVNGAEERARKAEARARAAEERARAAEERILAAEMAQKQT